MDRTSRDGALTPFIHKCFDAQVEEYAICDSQRLSARPADRDGRIILDGEMVAREPTTGLYLKFGTLKTTAISKSADAGRSAMLK